MQPLSTRRSDPDAGLYQPTNRQAVIATDAHGRWRLKLPPRWGGHVLTRSLEFTNSVFLNFDLVRRGYFHVHLVTDAGMEKRSAFWLLLRALMTRARRSIRVASKRAKPRSSIFCSMAAPREPAYSVVPNRILMVTPSFARGGSEQQTFNTAELLIRRGYEVCLLALRPLEFGEPGYMDEIKARGLEYRVLPRNLTQDLSVAEMSEELRCYAEDLPQWLVNFFDPVVRVIKEFRPAVVHCWLDQAVVIGGLSAGALGVPRIVAHQLVMIMDELPEAQQFHREGYLSLARNPAVTFVSNSKGGAVSYERWLGFRSNTFHILTNVLAPSTIRTPTAEEVSDFRTRLGLQPGNRVVSTVYPPVPQKDPELWVEAAAAIAARRPDVRFLIGGYGVLEQAVRRKISELGLEDRITMLGAITDLGLVYAATDIFMLSSRFEGLPCVLLECRPQGVPSSPPMLAAMPKRSGMDLPAIWSGNERLRHWRRPFWKFWTIPIGQGQPLLRHQDMWKHPSDPIRISRRRSRSMGCRGTRANGQHPPEPVAVNIPVDAADTAHGCRLIDFHQSTVLRRPTSKDVDGAQSRTALALSTARTDLGMSPGRLGFQSILSSMPSRCSMERTISFNVLPCPLPILNMRCSLQSFMALSIAAVTSSTKM